MMQCKDVSPHIADPIIVNFDKSSKQVIDKIASEFGPVMRD